MRDTSRREQFLDRAVASRRIPATRRAAWAAVYDRDPSGTEWAISKLPPLDEPDFDGSPYPRGLLPELARRTKRGGKRVHHGLARIAGDPAAELVRPPERRRRVTGDA